MEPERRRTLRVGVTVTVAVLLAMAGTFLIGREQQFWERKNSYEIRFTRINGLRVGSVVSLTGVDIGSVDIVLATGHGPIDPRLQPAGFALMAIGFVGLVLSFRRGGPPGNPNSQPPRPRWGRGGAGRP